MVDEEDVPDLGPCCGCGREGPEVRSVVMLHRRLPDAYRGTGWGCFQCGLPLDGAHMVLCDACLKADADVQTACVGYPAERRRVPLSELPEPFDHDRARHPEEWAWTEEVSDTCGVCGEPLPDPDGWDDLDEDNPPEIPLQLWRDGGREGLQMHWACAERCIQAGTLTMQAPASPEADVCPGA